MSEVEADVHEKNTYYNTWNLINSWSSSSSIDDTSEYDTDNEDKWL